MKKKKIKEKLFKGVTKDKTLHFRYGIYAGLVMFSIFFIYGIFYGILLIFLKINNPLLMEIIIPIILSIFLWFFIGFKALDKVRSICRKFNAFLVLFVIWATASSLSVLSVIFSNFITKQPLTQNVGPAFHPAGIIFLLIVEFFYKKSRKKKKS